MAYNENLFPSEVIGNPSAPYVYFDSLPDDIIEQVLPYFQQDINTISYAGDGTSAIDQAFSFLEAVISTERAKENAFIQYLKDKTKGAIQLEIPDIDSDWGQFVKEMQTVIDFGNTGMRNLQNEFERLKKNQANFEKACAAGQQQAWYEQDTLTKTSKQLRNMIKDFKEKTYNPTKTGSILLETILERYKDDLVVINKNTGSLMFNKGELAALLLSISQIVAQVYNTDTYNLERGEERRRISKETLNEVLDKSDIDDDVRKFLSNFRYIPSFRQDIIESFNLQYTDRGKKLSANGLVNDSTGEILSDTRELARAIQGKMQNYEFPKKAIQLVNTVNALAEVNSLLKFALAGAYKAVNTGSAGAKPDNILGFLTVDPTMIDDFTESQRNQVIETSEAILKRMDTMIESLSSKNTTEYYQEQGERWNTLSKEINGLLKQLEDIYGFLPSCFVIEDSTKNYLSLYSRIEDGELSNAPHGGSLGARLEDQLNKIDALTTAGHITMVDKKWLTAAIINCGPEMIAKEQKAKIENYLAMFAAILLFDGQINIAEEAMHYMTEQQMSATNVHQLHLFSVNNGYYPLSYVLKLTYDSLTKGLERIQDSVISRGVQVDIYGFVSKPDPKKYEGLPSWEATAEAAKKSTKIKMSFLVQFQNIVSNLLQLN